MLATAGVRRYISAAKTAEAINEVGVLANDGATAYASHKAPCKSASHPVPAAITAIQARAYVSTAADWTADPPDTGFSCLSFELKTPQYYQYDYQLVAPDTFEAIARGDLNGDGVTSEFSLHGRVVGGVVELDPRVAKIRPEE